VNNAHNFSDKLKLIRYKIVSTVLKTISKIAQKSFRTYKKLEVGESKNITHNRNTQNFEIL